MTAAPVTTTLAFQNTDLLFTIEQGDASTSKELAERGNIHPNHLNRKLEALTGEGFVAVPTGKATHEVELTEQGRQAVAELRRMTAPISPVGDHTLLHSEIRPDPDNRVIDETDPAVAASLDDLGETIIDALHTPIELTPAAQDDDDQRPMIFDGERRWRAIGRMIDQGRLPPTYRIEVRLRTDNPDRPARRRRLDALIVNLQREDWNPLDKGRAYADLIADGMTKEELAKAVGKVVRHVEQHVRIVQELSEDNKAKMRLPATLEDGSRNPDYLGVKAALALISTPRPKPALDLSDADQLVLLEAWDICRSVSQGGRGHPQPALERLNYAAIKGPPPVGLSIATAIRPILEFNQLGDGDWTVKINAGFRAGPQTGKWLADLGYYVNRDEALAKVRSAVHGDLFVAGRAPEDYATEWLAAPEPVDAFAEDEADAEAEEPEALEPKAEEPRETVSQAASPNPFEWNGKLYPNAVLLAEAKRLAEGGGPSNSGPSIRPATPVVESDDMPSAALLKLAGIKDASSEKPTRPTGGQWPLNRDLSPAMRLAMRELDDKLFYAAVSLPDRPGVYVEAGDYFSNADARALQQDLGLIGFLQLSGPGKLVYMTAAGETWLNIADMRSLTEERTRASKSPVAPGGDGRYWTPWLNRPAETVKAEATVTSAKDIGGGLVCHIDPSLTQAELDASFERSGQLCDDISSADRLCKEAKASLRASRELADHWSALSSEDLADRAHTAVQDGDVMTAIVSLWGLIEREGHDDARDVLVGRAEDRAEDAE